MRIIKDFYGWNALEYTWLVFALAFVAVLSVLLKSDALSIISAITNILCVFLIAKGRISNYLWGTIGVILYGYLSFKQHYYGNMLLNWGYYLPLQFVGLYLWRQHMNTSAVVKIKVFSNKARLVMLMLMLLSVCIFRIYLAKSDDGMPLADAFTTIASIFGMLFVVLRYAEQWLLWIAANMISCYMWFVPMLNHAPGAAATFAMWAVFLGNALYGAYLWFRKTRQHEKI